ncbi:winged helix-turn-helix domain-containing protein [Rubrivirga marina]|uniref:OmpR/PhoB-type domain-containing protein n=1 Tax=Rubrivirga marina TaxID=1196024 RepID=A0A271IWP2_9BACT|nr:transcriptional regulator [Rubrivirga marina]PAP75646.1 hypothetical protein BSZ37_03945 [Rubrivirga marina]
MPPATAFALGPWTVDPVANEVRRDGAAVRLEPKAVAVLVLLAERAGEVVTRDELMDTVWPDVVVTDASLTRCVSQLRQALGDDARGAGLIETVPKVGYRLHPPDDVAEAEPPDPGPASQRRALVLFGLAVALVLVVAPVLWRGPSAPTRVEYRVDVAGPIADARVTTTGADGTPVEEPIASFPFTRTVDFGERRSGTVEVRLRGRSAQADVRLAVTVRRGGAVLAEHTTTGSTAADSAESVFFYAAAQFGE